MEKNNELINANLEGKRFAYFVQHTIVDEKGEFIACCAFEGEPGYRLMDWHWGNDYKHAQKTADSKNELMGISKTEATKIILSTMRG